MFCKSCGADLKGTEKNCPNCGASIVQEDKSDEFNENSDDDTRIDDFVFKDSSNIEINDNTLEQEDKISPKRSNNKNIIIIVSICIGVILLLTIILFLIFHNKNKESNKDKTDINISSYMGYSFKIPDGYQSTLDKEYGLVIYSESLSYSIIIDYTNNYNSYLEFAKRNYPQYAKNMEVTLYGRKYAGIVIEKNGLKATEYVSKLDDSITYVGIVVRKDYKTPVREDYELLTKILDGAKKDKSYKRNYKETDFKKFNFDENNYKFAK